MTIAFATPPLRTPPLRTQPAARPGTAVGTPAPLRVIEGGRSAAARRHRRQILLHRLIAAVVLVGALVLLNAALSIGGPTTAPSAVGEPITESSYTVRSGDTMWDIAQRTRSGGDVRDTVALLSEVNGGDLVRVGQTLVIPDELRP